MGRQAYPNVRAIPQPPEMVVIIVPAEAVPQVLRDSAESGVKYAVVISAGFKEAGPEGYKLEKQLKEIVAETGIRVL